MACVITGQHGGLADHPIRCVAADTRSSPEPLAKVDRVQAYAICIPGDF